MKKLFIKIASFFILTICLNNIVMAQITRGATPGELYISTDWYMDEYGQVHYAILHSTDNGETVSLKYENIENTPPGEMRVGNVLGDAIPGTLYNHGNNELWVSFDYGENWEYREDYPDNAKYLCGQISGNLFKIIGAELSQSDNYGNTFTVITNPISCPIREPGYFLGEFYGINGSIGVGLFLDHTLDYANTYTEIPIDSAVAFWAPGGHYPQIIRGTEPGELYLVSWWLGDYYKVFHSVDTGYNWTEKFESDSINIYYWRVKYTAGREPGSFYVMRSRINPAGDHVWLYVDYSSDYGETFTTYFHDLDSLYTSISSLQKAEFGITVSPNPFSSFTNIFFELPVSHQSGEINILNIHGQLIRKIRISEAAKQLQWDGTNEKGMPVPQGVYLINICNGTYSSNYHKLLFTN